MTTMQEIDRAAQQLMDSVGPETIRKFFARYQDGSPTDESAPFELARPNNLTQTTYVDLSTIHITPEYLARKIDLDASAHMSAQGLLRRKEISEEEARQLEEKLKAHFHSENFQAWFKEQFKDEPFTALTFQFERLSRRVRENSVSYDLGLSTDKLRKALLRDTTISYDIPVDFYPAHFCKRHGAGSVKERLWTIFGTIRRKMIAKLVDFILDYAALALTYKSESIRTWREAYLLAMRASGGPFADIDASHKPFSETDADTLINLITKAYYDLFADMAFELQRKKIWGTSK